MFAVRLKISMVMAAFALLLVVAAYIFSLWSAERKKTEEIPFEAVQMLTRDLRRYHQNRGAFPEDLKKLEGPVWDEKPRNYSANNRALNHRHYYYLYTRQSPHQFTLWAIPTGPKREESPTWFVISNPKSARTWKGPALPTDQLDLITANPIAQALAVTGLVEQNDIKAGETSPKDVRRDPR